MTATTVVIPLYNKRRYVRGCVESALRVEGVREVIVIDDGSTDGSPAELSAVADSRLRIVAQANAGPGAARNHGLALCSSPLVVFLDADDELFPGFASGGAAILEQHADCQAVIHGWRAGDATAVDIERYAKCGISRGPYRLPPAVDGETFKRVVDLCHSGAILARTDAVRACGGFYARDRCTFGEDSYLWTQFLTRFGVWFTLEAQMWFNIEGSELSVGRKGMRRLRPILFATDPVRASAGKEYGPALERLLEFYAAHEAIHAARSGRAAMARELLERFPGAATSQPEVYQRARRLVRLGGLLDWQWRARQGLRGAPERA